jgi:hypothetical protein
MSRKMRYFRRNLNLYQELAREHVAHCERLKMAYSVEKLQKFLYEKFIFDITNLKNDLVRQSYW